MAKISYHTESELIESLKKGEDPAYRYLYDHYAASLYGVILQVIPQKEVANDLLQEVFVKIYKKIDFYESEKGRLFTWMMQITRNTAIDKARSKDFKNKKKTQPLSNSENQSSIPFSEFPYMNHIGLEKVLEVLDTHHREIINFAYFKGYTQKEISEELDIPLGTVKTRVRNALIQLRQSLKIT